MRCQAVKSPQLRVSSHHHQRFPHMWTASGSLLMNWRFHIYFFHKHPPSLAVLRRVAMAHWIPTTGKISRLFQVQLTHWQAEFYSCLIDIRTMVSRRTASRTWCTGKTQICHYEGSFGLSDFVLYSMNHKIHWWMLQFESIIQRSQRDLLWKLGPWIGTFSAACKRSGSHPLNTGTKKPCGVWSSCAVHSSSDPPDHPLENCRITWKVGRHG